MWSGNHTNALAWDIQRGKQAVQQMIDGSCFIQTAAWVSPILDRWRYHSQGCHWSFSLTFKLTIIQLSVYKKRCNCCLHSVTFVMSPLNVRGQYYILNFPSEGSIKDYLVLYCQRGKHFLLATYCCIVISSPSSHRASNYLQPPKTVKRMLKKREFIFWKIVLVFWKIVLSPTWHILSFSPLPLPPSVSCSRQNIHTELHARAYIRNIMFSV